MDLKNSSQSTPGSKSGHKYNELDSIDENLLKIIVRFIIFTDIEGTDVFLMTDSDDVFGFGMNFRGRLGFGHKEEVKEPKVLPELCGKSVIDIKCGDGLSVALTQTGQIYLFGLFSLDVSDFGDNDYYHKPEVMPVINQLFVAIDCTDYSTHMLTQTGQLYWFGYSVYNDDLVLIPNKIAFPSGIKIESISCGGDHTLALTVDGKVFSWGLNGYGQLGLGHTNLTESPQIIGLNEVIKQVCCGDYYSFLLTTNGNLYAFGLNSSGRLGIGCINQQITPKLVITGQKEICCYRDISMSLDVNNKLFIWGNIEKGFVSPVLSELKSFQEIVDKYAKHRSTLKPIELLKNN